MKKAEVNEGKIQMIKERLDYFLENHDSDTTSDLICKVICDSLDEAEEEEKLNVKERRAIRKYIKKRYGYDF